MKTLISNLKKYRTKHELSQDKLAKKLEVTRQTINAIEQGKYQPSLFLAHKCARLFKVNIEDIFNFK